MCFELKNGSRVKIAKADIECWKVLSLDDTPLYEYRNPPYQKGVICSDVELVPYSLDDKRFIDAGYHSFKSSQPVFDGMSIARQQFKEFPRTLKKFIIPAGTRYYENDTEYVSETIMLVGKPPKTPK